jgi:hypothetical protein
MEVYFESHFQIIIHEAYKQLTVKFQLGQMPNFHILLCYISGHNYQFDSAL